MHAIIRAGSCRRCGGPRRHPRSDGSGSLLGEASRRPGRPSLVRRVYEAAAASATLDRVVVATPDAEIAIAVRDFGGEAVLTGPHQPTATDRVAEVAAATADVVANVQDDQPFVTPAMLKQLVARFAERPDGAEVVMTTLGAPLSSAHDPADLKCRQGGVRQPRRRPSLLPQPHTVRPSPCAGAGTGVLPPRATCLRLWTCIERWRPPLELAEGLEQLRAIEHWVPHPVSLTEAPAVKVNTPEDLTAALDFAAAAGGG